MQREYEEGGVTKNDAMTTGAVNVNIPKGMVLAPLFSLLCQTPSGDRCRHPEECRAQAEAVGARERKFFQ